MMAQYNQIAQSIDGKNDVSQEIKQSPEEKESMTQQKMNQPMELDEHNQISFTVIQNIVQQYLTQLPNIQYSEDEIINLIFQDTSLSRFDKDQVQNQTIYAINSIVNYLSLKHAADVITNKVQALALGEETHEGENEILDLQDFEALNLQKELENVMKEQINVQIETSNLQNKLKLLQNE